MENILCHKGLVEASTLACQRKKGGEPELRAAFEHPQRGWEYLTLGKLLTLWKKQELVYVSGLLT